MNKFLVSAVAMIVSATSVFAQTTKSINAGEFNSLDVSGNIAITIVTDGGDENFSYTLPENVTEDQFEWENKNGVLTLKLKDQLVIGKGKKVKPSATVSLVCSTLKEVKASSKASIVSKDEFKSDDLTFSVNGGSTDVAMNLNVVNLTINATTSSKITLSGKVEYLTIKANSAAYVNTITMECQNATIATSTNAECYATAIKRFEAKASTNSNVFYKGKPEIVKVSNTTLGAVEHF